MLSLLTPIYQSNFLQGVTGLDVTLNIFSSLILSKRLQWQSGALVVDEKGNILTVSRAAKSYLGLTDLSNYNTKDDLKNRAAAQPTQLNLLQGGNAAGMQVLDFFKQQKPSLELEIQGREYLMTKQKINETGWQLLVMAPLENVYSPILAEKAKITQLGMSFLALALVFYSLFFLHINRSSKRLAKRITSPITYITNMIGSYDNSHQSTTKLKPVDIEELDNLLSMNLQIQDSKVRYQKISQEMKLKNQQLKTLAITDQLTQLYNRLKLDEVLMREIAQSQHESTPLVVIILDIDRFKQVNDTFGHRVGDSVLISVSRLLLSNIRATDTIGRWGGEEFLLILPDTPIENARIYADKLRGIIEEADFSPVKQVTISMGLASLRQQDTESALVERADTALYQAKNNGRNRVEVASA